MKIAAAVALLHLCLSATVSGDDSTETTVTASPGDVALLPCYTSGNVTPSVTTWEKNGREVISGGDSSSSSPSSPQRLTVLHDGSLNINGVTPGDEGSYLCASTLPGNIAFHARVLLQVTDGPDRVSTSIDPGHVLPNGTIIVYQGSSISFNCSASSYPSQQLTWAFTGASSSNVSLTSGSRAWLVYRIEDVQPSAQGVYSCTANNTVSYQAVNRSSQLLVYYAPDRHPECMWSPAQDPSYIQFTCSWSGAYPTPTLSWEGDGGAQGQGHVYATEVTDSLSVNMNRSQLSDGQTLRCTAQHQTLATGEEKSCSFTLKAPYPVGEPMATALEATSVTLTCSEETSIPPANTTWRRGMEQDVIVSGSKYVLSVEGPVYKLTILNVSTEDGGFYFCRSENPLAITELEVYLTVKASSEYTGAIVGIFIAALIVGSAVIIAKTVYSSRHRICLGNLTLTFVQKFLQRAHADPDRAASVTFKITKSLNHINPLKVTSLFHVFVSGGGFGQMEEDRGDVLSLVESEDEQIFQDTVPELPPLPNGRQTTLVEIHRIPSSDHEDVETADTSPEQQGDTEQTEELVDLVTF